MPNLQIRIIFDNNLLSFISLSAIALIFAPKATFITASILAPQVNHQ